MARNGYRDAERKTRRAQWCAVLSIENGQVRSRCLEAKICPGQNGRARLSSERDPDYNIQISIHGFPNVRPAYAGICATRSRQTKDLSIVPKLIYGRVESSATVKATYGGCDTGPRPCLQPARQQWFGAVLRFPPLSLCRRVSAR